MRSTTCLARASKAGDEVGSNGIDVGPSAASTPRAGAGAVAGESPAAEVPTPPGVTGVAPQAASARTTATTATERARGPTARLPADRPFRSGHELPCESMTG